MSFTLPIKILFQHCDPAGIVFFPRYFEMINLVVEEWFEQSLGYPFAQMQSDGFGVPTVTIKTDFTAPSRLGDRVDFQLTVAKLGRTSVTLDYVAKAGEETRLTAQSVLVYMDKSTGRPLPWPSAVRDRIAAHLD